MKFALALAVVLAATSARAAEGMPQNGFVLEARLGAAATVAGGAASSAYITLVPSVFLGGRMVGRVHLGVSTQLIRAAVNAGGSSTTYTDFTFAPALAVDLVKSADQRVAFFGKAEIPLGAAIVGSGNRNDAALVAGYQVALGARFAPHRMFAVGFEAGLLGMWVAPGKPSGTSATSLYVALAGTFFAAR